MSNHIEWGHASGSLDALHPRERASNASAIWAF
jgi:hypothetical protein